MLFLCYNCIVAMDTEICIPFLVRLFDILSVKVCIRLDLFVFT